MKQFKTKDRAQEQSPNPLVLYAGSSVTVKSPAGINLTIL